MVNILITMYVPGPVMIDRNVGPSGEFVGGITDPRPIGLDASGRVRFLDEVTPS